MVAFPAREFVKHPHYPLILDPQTAGGLLASVLADRIDACIAGLKAAGKPNIYKTGRILPQDDALELIVLV